MENENRKFIKNLLHYLTTYGLRYVLGFFISTLVIRHLGSVEYGKFAYVISIGALLSGISSLGLSAVIPQLLGKSKYDFTKIISNTVVLLILSGLLASLTSILTVLFFKRNYLDLILIYSIVFPFGASQGIKYYFEIIAELKWISLINNIVILSTNALKLYGIYFNYSVEWFIVVFVIEGILTFLGYFSLILKKNLIKISIVSYSTMKNYVTKGLPFMLSSMMVILYMKTDLLMLEYITNIELVGIYAETIRLVEIFFFIPVLFQTTYFPFISEALNNKKKARIKMRNQYLIVTGILFTITLIILIFSPQILRILYEKTTSESILTLRIYSISLLLVGVGTIRNHLVNYFELSKFYLRTTILAAIINIILNMLLIPIYGIIGCAISTLVAQFYASILSSLFNDILRKDLISIFYLKSYD